MFSRDLRPFARLFDEIEAAANHQNSSPLFRSGHLNLNSFNPSFDVRETKDSYVLDGELPGLSDKSALDLSFIDDSTLVIKGRIERKNESGKPTQEGNAEEKSGYHSPTVEEEGETAVTKTSTNTEVQKKQPETDRYWVRERYVGEFQRAFSFPQRVDHDAVKASLKDGILSVIVPKKQGPNGPRKISVE
jgi:HSP20 family molecular chaperone IbpA